MLILEQITLIKTPQISPKHIIKNLQYDKDMNTISFNDTSRVCF